MDVAMGIRGSGLLIGVAGIALALLPGRSQAGLELEVFGAERLSSGSDESGVAEQGSPQGSELRHVRRGVESVTHDRNHVDSTPPRRRLTGGRS